MLRLDSCRSADPAALVDPRRITADFLPHVPGQELTYDLAEYPVPGKLNGPVQRIIFLQREAETATTETIITHAGTLSGKGLVGNAGQWLTHKKTTKARLPGPVYFQRFSGTFVEIGEQVVKDGRKQVTWHRALKIGARTGDTWHWTQGNLSHDCMVEKFDHWTGQPSLVIRDTVTNVADPAHAVEKRHIYVRDVGEVEQEDWLLLTSKDRVLVGEKRLVDVEGARNAPDPKGKPAATPEQLGRPMEGP